MNLIVLVLLFASAAFAQAPRIIFTKQFPGSQPAYFSIALSRSGALEYKEAPNDDHPLKAQMSEADTTRVFDSANKVGNFATPLESGLKVANTGKKTFRYEDGSGKSLETSFNYSTDPAAQQLLQQFEEIGESERAYIDLQRAARFDKLGVNDALARIEQLWLRKQLAAPAQFIPLLKRIASHESYMHMARERAARLKDAFELPATSAQAGNTAK